MSKTNCIEISLLEPLEVLKGCGALLSSLDDGFSDTLNSHIGIKLIADLIVDAVSRIEEMKEVQ